MSQLDFDLVLPEKNIRQVPLINVIKTEYEEKKGIRNYKKEFITLFKSTAQHHKRYKVFSDFLAVSSIAIQNSVLKCKELEDEYFKIIRSYEKKDLLNFSTLLSFIVAGLESCTEDFLGSVYMDLELGNKDTGQFFTPFYVSELMSEVLLGDVADTIKTKGYVSLCEPTAGAGGMIIAVAKNLRDKNYNPQTQMLAVCTDIDSDAAGMCYIQLSLLGIPAVVNTGNTLTNIITKTWYTPFYYFNSWRFR